MPQGDVLMQMAGQYAPVASGVPFAPVTGFEGVPLAGDNPLLGLGLQMFASPLLARMNMAPLGFSDRNAFDVAQNQRFWRMQNQMREQAARLDRDNYVRTFRGFAALTGTPWGAQQMRAAGSLSDKLIAATPLMTQLAPDLLDELAGPRGSFAVMADQMLQSSRYRIDPVTGRLGQDPDTVMASAQQMYDDVFRPGRLSQTGGLSAGQFGQLAGQLSSRGLLGGAPALSPGDMLRRQDPGLLQAAAIRQGLDPARTAAGMLSGNEQDKLTTDPDVANRLRSFDAEKVKQSLQGYVKVVNAVRDIFGDMGRPNAPMSELIGALDALTNNSLGQVQPGQLNMMVRMTHQLAQQTGVGLDNAMIMQQHLSGRAEQLGLSPLSAVNANQGAMAFGAAFRSQGLPPAWGRFNADQMMQLDGQLRLSAAASQAAQRMGVAIRLNEAVGGFAAGSDSARYVEALKNAQDTGVDYWVDSAGRQRNLNMDKAEWSRLLIGSGRANAQQLNEMLGQRSTTEEQIQRFGLADPVRRTQGRTQMTPWIASNLQGFLQTQMQNQGVNREDARHAAAAAAAAATRRIMAMDAGTFADHDARNKAVADILHDTLGSTAAGGRLNADFYAVTAESFKGYMDRITATSRDYGALRNFQNVFDVFNDRTQDRASRVQVEQRLNAHIRDAVAPLNRGGALRRAIGYLQDVKPGDEADAWKLAATAIGAVDGDQLRKELEPVMGDVRGRQTAMEKAQAAILAESDPGKKQGLLAQYRRDADALRKQVGVAVEGFARLGYADETLSSSDTSRAANLAGMRGEMDAALAGRKGSFADFWSGDSGRLYRETARNQGEAAGDVALKLLSSQEAVGRFGLEGVERARRITESNQEVLRMAAVYAGGDVGRLVAGDYAKGDLSAKERSDVALRVRQQLDLRDESVRWIYAEQQKGGGRRWDAAGTARELGVSVRDAELARDMDPATARAALEARGLQGEQLVNAKREMMSHYKGAGTADELVSAAGVYAKMKDRADQLTAVERMDPAELAKDFMSKYGVSVDGKTEQEKQQLMSLGQMLKSEPGQALRAGLLGGRDVLAGVARRGGVKEKDDLRAIDAVYSEYQKVLAAKPGDRAGAESAFRGQFGLSDDGQFSQFQRAMQLQIETGFIHFGDSGGGLGQRTSFDLASANEMMGRTLATGKLQGDGDRNVKVTFPDGMTISGKLQLEGNTGTITGQTTAENSAGVNSAVTSGGGGDF